MVALSFSHVIRTVMSSSIKSIIVLLSLLLAVVQGCYNKHSTITKSDCAKFPKSSTGCKRVFLGKRQSEDISLSLYRAAAESPTIEQENLLLVPLEVSRVISALVHATEKKERDQNSVDQMRCYVASAGKKLRKNILVPANEDKQKVEKRRMNSSADSPRMMVVDRQIFVDETLQASENYSKEAVCWYEMDLTGVDFKDGSGAKAVNEWADAKHKRALDLISDISKEDKARDIRKPLAGDPKNIEHALAVVASSIYLKMAWKKGLFKKVDKPSEHFLIKLRGNGEHKNAETNVKIPMMSTVGEFNFVESASYVAVSLPLAGDAADGAVIFVLPQKQANLTEVEEEVFGSGTNLRAFLQTVRAAKPKKVSVTLPRLTVQVTHEWGTPRNRSLKQIVSMDKGKALQGNSVGVYQDTFLEMIENTAAAGSDKQTTAASTTSAKTTTTTETSEDLEESAPRNTSSSGGKFVADRPFLFVMTVDRDLVAFGRIADPYWCKFCENRHGGGNHTSNSSGDNKMERDNDKNNGGGKSFFQKVKDFFTG